MRGSPAHLSFALVVFALPACRSKVSSAPDASEASAATEVVAAGEAEAAKVDTREDLVRAARESWDAGAYDGPRIGAMSMQTSVLSTTEWPESDGGPPSTRLGYLRHGAKVPVIPQPIVNDACPEGWFELVVGGFVCGKYATLDLKHPRVRLAPSPPNTAAALPYRYGYNLANGTPLYRRVLSVEDRKKHEPWLLPKPAAVEDAGEPEAAGEDTEPVDAGAPPAPAASTPWYMRTYDGGRPQITLDDLHGRGVLVRRMVRGFYLALDRDFRAAHARWWRTTAGFAVPFDRVAVQQPLPEFRGLWLAGDDVADAGAGAEGGPSLLPEGGTEAPLVGNGSIVFVRSSSAHTYKIDPEKKKIAWGEAIARRSAAELTGTTFALGGVTYDETTRKGWLQKADVMAASPSKPPDDLAPGEKWIDVDLTRQILVAFEGEKPVFATLIASGKRNPTDKEKDHPTPVGTYRIREKHITANMDGDVAADGPYSIEDVPWIMYFQGSYALHGAFWHAQFGRTMSHGCVNLSPADARTIFRWTEPHLPDGWHGVFAQSDHAGTRVIVHEDPKP